MGSQAAGATSRSPADQSREVAVARAELARAHEDADALKAEVSE